MYTYIYVCVGLHYFERAWSSILRKIRGSGENYKRHSFDLTGIGTWIGRNITYSDRSRRDIIINEISAINVSKNYSEN